jgi:hypothetical protein
LRKVGRLADALPQTSDETVELIHVDQRNAGENTAYADK